MELLGEAVEVFGRANQQVRANFISNLFDHLRPSEKHALHSRLLQDTFFFDILGHLPLEIALQIAGDLDPRDIIRLRRVSSRWMFILSSKDLARTLIRNVYSDRSDIPDYQSQIRDDPLSSLRNMSFRQYAGESGIYKFRGRLGINQELLDKYDFHCLGFTPNITYAVFKRSERSMSMYSPSDKWYLANLVDLSIKTLIPLWNRRREKLDDSTLHAGDYFVVGTTIGTRRALVWNTQGELVYEFALLSEEGISIASSESYVIVRNEHLRACTNDFYILNTSTKTLQVQEGFVDLIKQARQEIPHHQNLTKVAMSILEESQEIFLTGSVVSQIAVVRIRFGEKPEEQSLVQGEMRFISCNGAEMAQYGHTPTVNHKLRNTYYFTCLNQTTECMNIQLTCRAAESSRLIFNNLGPRTLRAVPRLERVTPAAFCYRDTIYGFGVASSGGSGNHWVIWRFNHGKERQFIIKPLLEVDGPLDWYPWVKSSDKGFLMGFNGKLFLFEWLDFDAFMGEPFTATEIEYSLEQ